MSRGRRKGFDTVSGLVEDRLVRSELSTDELLGASPPSDLSIDGGEPFFLLERMLVGFTLSL